MWKYGIVLKTLTRAEAGLFDVVAPMQRRNDDGTVNTDKPWNVFVSVESLNWGARHDKIVNDSITAFNLANDRKVTTERMIRTYRQRRQLGTKP